MGEWFADVILDFVAHCGQAYVIDNKHRHIRGHLECKEMQWCDTMADCSCIGSSLTGHVIHGAGLGCSGSVFTAACLSFCQWYVHTNVVQEQHSTINCTWRRCEARCEVNGGYTRYWLLFCCDLPNTLHFIAVIMMLSNIQQLDEEEKSSLT